jgi:hypothetical protein
MLNEVKHLSVAATNALLALWFGEMLVYGQ